MNHLLSLCSVESSLTDVAALCLDTVTEPLHVAEEELTSWVNVVLKQSLAFIPDWQ